MTDYGSEDAETDDEDGDWGPEEEKQDRKEEREVLQHRRNPATLLSHAGMQTGEEWAVSPCPTDTRGQRDTPHPPVLHTSNH